MFTEIYNLCYTINMLKERNGDLFEQSIIEELDRLNSDKSHFVSRDDICTPMECVKKMLDYIPLVFWEKKNIKVLDPCCGNGNFGAYCKTKTNDNNIYYNDTNLIRLENCKSLLYPKHINNEDFFHLTGKFDTTYDLIMANPPYSGGGNKNRSLSNAFIEESIDRLNKKGYLCFITPNNWMTYNSNNTTLKKLLTEGSFIVIDNSAKHFFKNVGSSFTIFIWQKGVTNNKTYVVNDYLIKDVQKDVVIPKNLNFIPLYLSNSIISIIQKAICKEENNFTYRCDLHNFTQKAFLNDIKTDKYKYETIHTPNITRYASKKQDIYDDYVIIIPLSNYFIPYIRTHVNTTQSVGYFAFKTQKEA